MISTAFENIKDVKVDSFEANVNADYDQVYKLS
jgi:hypothetical protein